MKLDRVYLAAESCPHTRLTDGYLRRAIYGHVGLNPRSCNRQKLVGAEMKRSLLDSCGLARKCSLKVRQPTGTVCMQKPVSASTYTGVNIAPIPRPANSYHGLMTKSPNEAIYEPNSFLRSSTSWRRHGPHGATVNFESWRLLSFQDMASPLS